MEHTISAYTVKQGYIGLNTRGIEKTVQIKREAGLFDMASSHQSRGDLKGTI